MKSYYSARSNVLSNYLLCFTRRFQMLESLDKILKFDCSKFKLLSNTFLWCSLLFPNRQVWGFKAKPPKQMKTWSVDIEMKPFEQYFPLKRFVLLLSKLLSENILATLNVHILDLKGCNITGKSLHWSNSLILRHSLGNFPSRFIRPEVSMFKANKC